MLQSDSYRKGLYKIAAITSVGWGIISVFPRVATPRHLPWIERPPRDLPPGNFSPRNIPENAATGHLVLSAIGITALMLSLWLMNIFLHERLKRTNLGKKKRNITRYTLSYLATIIIFYVFVIGFSLLTDSGRPMFFPLIVALTNNTIILVLMDLIVLQKNAALIELENTQLKMNNVIAQHQHLKHQLQPHFLFNSLNTLKSLIKRKPQEAEDYLIRLSDILRAAITGDRQDTLPLKDELKLCIDYLEMQKVRFKDAFTYEISVPEKIKQTGWLPLFSLQLLVENAIKHNAFTAEEPLHISIAYNELNECITVCNNKKVKQMPEPSPGIGLKNLSERYKVISGQEISIMETEASFCVELLLLHKWILLLSRTNP